MATVSTVGKENSFIAGFEAFERTPEAGRHAWLGPARRAAISRFAELGFPTPRDEEWLYTNVAPIARTPFRTVPEPGRPAPLADLSDYTFAEIEGCLIVFLDGRYCEGLCSFKCPQRSPCARSLAGALESERALVEAHLGSLASFEKSAFTALNAAYLADGAFIRVPPGTALEGIVHILYLSSGREAPGATHPRTLIVAGEGSRAAIVESYAGLDGAPYLTNAVTEIVAGAGSTVDHYKIQREGPAAFHVSATHVRQEAGSVFSTHSISLGGALVRNDLRAVLDGEGCEAILNGLYLARGKGHVDNATVIDHARPNCSSRELYKGILGESATGAFTGRIVVRPDAQKTNSKQTNRNLLLSEEALVHTRPQLEIFADDVKCTHGATVGHIDDEELFYMRSRGIDRESARTLLTYAFASDILGGMKVKPVQCQIDLVLLNRLAQARG